MLKSKIAFVCVILVFALFGCAVAPKINKNIETKQPGQSIVFGKINIESGAVGIRTMSYCCITKMSDLSEDGFGFSNGDLFFVVLDSGEYRISSILEGYGLTGALGFTEIPPINIDRGFSVGENEVIYIGNMSANFICGRKSFWSGDVIEPDRWDIEITDEYDDAVKEFRKKYPNIKQNIQKKLLM